MAAGFAWPSPLPIVRSDPSRPHVPLRVSYQIETTVPPGSVLLGHRFTEGIDLARHCQVNGHIKIGLGFAENAGGILR